MAPRTQENLRFETIIPEEDPLSEDEIQEPPETYSIDRYEIMVASNDGEPHVPVIPLDKADEFCPPRILGSIMERPRLPLWKQYRHGWDRFNCSSAMQVERGDPLTCFKKKVTNTSDAIKGRGRYKKGIHIWEFDWPKRELNSVVGVGDPRSQVRGVGNMPFVGSKPGMWGWELVQGDLYHGRAKRISTYPSFVKPWEELLVPEIFYMILDMNEGTLAFAAGSLYLGIAFRGLEGKTLTPMISTYSHETEITMRYLGGILGDGGSTSSSCSDCFPSPLGSWCAPFFRKSKRSTD